MNHHAQRLVVGVILLALVVPGIVCLASVAIVGIFALLCLPALHEWGKLVCKDSNRKRQFSYLLLCVFGISTLAWLSVYKDYRIVLYVAALWWFIALVLSTFYNSSLCSNSAFRWFLYLHIIIALAACLVAVYLLHTVDWYWLLYTVALVAVSDTSAYYVGRRIGKNKLAPHISFGKTKEGFVGALIATLILSLFAVSLFIENATLLGSVSLVLLSLIACIAGVVGDLTESMAKRCAGVKDSGKLLPGHGGVLDRMDAFLAAAPVMALGVWYH